MNGPLSPIEAREMATRLLASEDFASAFQLAAIWADVGEVWAQSLLGTCLQCGLGVPINIESAEYWLRRAVSGGDPLACANLATLLSTCGRDARAEIEDLHELAVERGLRF